MRAITITFVVSALSLAPSALFAQSHTLTNLYSFQGGDDGGQPTGGLVAGPNGALYGSTVSDGAQGGGTVFELIPPVSPADAWTYTVIYTFQKNSGDGYSSSGRLVFGQNGSLYGATLYGGPGNNPAGIVFELSPPAIRGAPWTETILYTFNGNRDGTNPGPITMAPDGVIYGTLEYPGAKVAGRGNVYSLKKGAEGVWKKTTLYNFTTPNSAYPTGILALDAKGALYGACEGPETYVYPGSVYQLVPPTTTGGAWTYNLLYTFKLTGNDGLSPIGGVIFGLNGALYGTTAAGGSVGAGAVFELAPPASPGGTWTETILYSFTGGADGSYPWNGLAVTNKGVLFGVAQSGGLQSPDCDNTCGTAFRLAPPASPSSSWTFTTLHDFAGGADGQYPSGPLHIGMDSSIYGVTTGRQDPVNAGTVFQIQP